VTARARDGAFVFAFLAFVTVLLFPIMVPAWLLVGLAHLRTRWPRRLRLSLLVAWGALALWTVARALYLTATVPAYLRGGTWAYVVAALVVPPAVYLVLEFLYWVVETDSGGMPRLHGEPGYASPHVPAHERGVQWRDGWYWRRGGDGAWWRSYTAGGPWELA
jgi:hypothetical protein